METHSTISDWVKDLDMADGLKQLLIDAGFTIESVIERCQKYYVKFNKIDKRLF